MSIKAIVAKYNLYIDEDLVPVEKINNKKLIFTIFLMLRTWDIQIKCQVW